VITRPDVAIPFVGALVAIGVVLPTVGASSAQSPQRTIERVAPLRLPDEATIPEGPVGVRRQRPQLLQLSP